MIRVNIKGSDNKVSFEQRNLGKKIFKTAALFFFAGKGCQVLTNEVYFVNSVFDEGFNFLYD